MPAARWSASARARPPWTSSEPIGEHRRSRMTHARSLAASLLVLCLAGSARAASDPALIDAAKTGRTAEVTRLLRAGADVNVRQVDGTTALHWAASLDDVETAKVLVAAGADASVVNRYGVTPLSAAAGNGSAPMLELLF